MPIGNVAATPGTNVSGVIDRDTLWDPEDSPFTLVGNILVVNGFTLTIKPGVQVLLNGFFIEVDGTLRARGGEREAGRIIFSGHIQGLESWDANMIKFNPISAAFDETTEGGSIIKNADIVVSAPQTAIRILGASPKIENNLLVNRNRTGDSIHVSGSATIKGNTIKSRVLIEGGSPLVINNVIREVGSGNTAGIYITGGTPRIEGNLIVDNPAYEFGGGIRVDRAGTNAAIVGNTISNNINGIFLLEGAKPLITQNNIFGNTRFDLILFSTPNDVTVTNNWWGTTDESRIALKIFDKARDFRLGAAIFKPFLRSPVPTPAVEVIIQSSNTPSGTNVFVNLQLANVRFRNVMVAGVTSATKTINPGLAGFLVVGEFVDLSTTAAYAGTVTVSVRYDLAQIPSRRSENEVRIFQFVDGAFQDITVSFDIVEKRVTGQTTTLSVFVAGVFPQLATTTVLSATTVFLTTTTTVAAALIQDQSWLIVFAVALTLALVISMRLRKAKPPHGLTK